MRVLNLPLGADTGGNGHRTMEAFRRHRPDWTYNLCSSSVNYMRYPVGDPWRDVMELWQAADVVHLRNTFDCEAILGVEPKPTVIQHHGTYYRTSHNQLRAVAAERGAVSLVSTLDLWLIAPDETEWLPSPYDLDWLAQFAKPTNDGVLRIAHAPTNRRVKSTDAFLQAVERLRKDVQIEVDLIERETWENCLRRKGRADVYFDQTLLGYGNNAIEAWGMGVPVIAGAQDETLDEMERRFGSLPFVLAEPTAASIHAALWILADEKQRRFWSARGMDHVAQWHDEAAVVKQLVDAYERAHERAKIGV